MRPALVLLLLGVVLLSGCTIPGTGIEIPGLPDIPGLMGATTKEKADVIVIKELTVIPTKAEAGETVKVLAQVQNLGDEKFTIIKAAPNPGEKKIFVQLFDYCPGLFGEPTPKTTTTDILPQEIKQFEWTLTAGSPPVQTKCKLKVSATYGFTTESTTTITFIDQNEYERQLQDNSFRSTNSQLSIGKGPLRTYLTVEDPQPVPAKSLAKIELQLKNEGSGFVGTHEVTENNVRTVNVRAGDVTVKAPGLQVGKTGTPSVDVDCFLKDGGEITAKILKEGQRLIREKTSPLRCAVELMTKDVPKEITKLMTVEARYVYDVRKEVTATVEPKLK